MEHWVGKQGQQLEQSMEGKSEYYLGWGFTDLQGFVLLKFWFLVCVRWKTFEGFLFDSHFNSVTGHFVKTRLENKGRSKRLLQ